MASRQTPLKWKLDRLKEHPRQIEMFGNLSDSELQALAEDMKTNGQQEPLEICPDGTVISGHQRWRAAIILGWVEILAPNGLCGCNA